MRTRSVLSPFVARSSRARENDLFYCTRAHMHVKSRDAEAPSIHMAWYRCGLLQFIINHCWTVWSYWTGRRIQRFVAVYNYIWSHEMATRKHSARGFSLFAILSLVALWHSGVDAQGGKWLTQPHTNSVSVRVLRLRWNGTIWFNLCFT